MTTFPISLEKLKVENRELYDMLLYISKVYLEWLGLRHRKRIVRFRNIAYDAKDYRKVTLL
jgi:hypothetical protein